MKSGNWEILKLKDLEFFYTKPKLTLNEIHECNLIRIPDLHKVLRTKTKKSEDISIECLESFKSSKNEKIKGDFLIIIFVFYFYSHFSYSCHHIILHFQFQFQVLEKHLC